MEAEDTTWQRRRINISCSYIHCNTEQGKYDNSGYKMQQTKPAWKPDAPSNKPTRPRVPCLDSWNRSATESVFKCCSTDRLLVKNLRRPLKFPCDQADSGQGFNRSP
jgi:hypothetical protein